ncbi:glycerol kinase [Sphaerisporangium siamense]|uniref:ATP:glycerol 3-phosphotransferase n=1 Tax=Sphaerisporangium siamense TaxID=795645 RepID=A0A7W7GA21_9ACTN|nr:glycerol kinase [Sphaerisporangium siamense]MBB4699521.1 glycerol kinase [Sphaerisporangium siamense]GII86935.1 glycerol kinase [Sphaerisporangium siamense]
MSVLAVDAGTTGVTALVVSEQGRVVAKGHREFPQHFPAPGRVEHDPGDIWAAVLDACSTALGAAEQAGATPVSCVGLTNQRETVVLWDRATLRPATRAIVWQDRRSAGECDRLREHEPRIRALTGLPLDPYFSATKLSWLRANDPGTWDGVRAGRVAVGTVDSYLLARLTGGRLHATDPSNASRTLLFDLAAARWSAELTELFGVPEAALPEIVPSSAPVGRTAPEHFLGLDVPICGIAGDQQAALFGHAAFAPGDMKCTYGTGSFLLVNTGDRIAGGGEALLSTVAWQLGGEPVKYALEGSVFVTGAAVQWLRDGLGLIDDSAGSERLAASVAGTEGLVFVPALTGIGSPHWDPAARGALLGITRGTTAAHLARAVLEGIAYQIRDVVEAVAGPAGIPVSRLAVDGGASANDLLCQIQADLLGRPVARPETTETTGLGAAFLAGLAGGVWSGPAEIAAARGDVKVFSPREVAEDGYRRWLDAVDAVRRFGS